MANDLRMLLLSVHTDAENVSHAIRKIPAVYSYYMSSRKDSNTNDYF
jgi:hypothetical protein